MNNIAYINLQILFDIISSPFACVVIFYIGVGKDSMTGG